MRINIQASNYPQASKFLPISGSGKKHQAKTFLQQDTKGFTQERMILEIKDWEMKLCLIPSRNIFFTLLHYRQANYDCQ